jgi:hypothetical protein
MNICKIKSFPPLLLAFMAHLQGHEITNVNISISGINENQEPIQVEVKRVNNSTGTKDNCAHVVTSQSRNGHNTDSEDHDIALESDKGTVSQTFLIGVDNGETNTPMEYDTLPFRCHIHESLPKSWVSEFKKIMAILQELIPVKENFDIFGVRKNDENSAVDIYAWNSIVKNPFLDKPNMGGDRLSGDGRTMQMDLEINKDEFKNDHLHRYAIIVHHYFHIYQASLSKGSRYPKWLISGAAKVIEEMFVQQYYGRSSLKNDLKRRFLWSDKVFSDPYLYEQHERSHEKNHDGYMDMNAAGSAFMLLTLVKELQKDNFSEPEAFKLVFRDFWLENAGQSWQKAFKKTFNMSVDTYYERLSQYSRDDVRRILPSKSLKIQEIFD